MAFDKIAAGLTEVLRSLPEASGHQSLPKVKRQHIGCNAALCPNGKCNATGECQDNPVR